jgi:hypothetical protein
MKFFTIIITLLIITSCNQNQTESKKDIIATWRGGSITLKEYEEFALKNFFNSDPVEAAESTVEKKREALDYLINSEIIWNIYDSLRLDTVKVIKDAYEKRLYRTAYNSTLFMDSVQNKIASNERINEFYDLLKNKYNISHILLNSEETALSIYADIKNNSKDFSKAAREFSYDTGSKETGGNLGWNFLSNFVPEFSDNVLKIKKGQITEPFKTKFGWHIAKLNDIQLNMELGSLEKEIKNIRYAILSKHKDEYERLNKKWENYLFYKYKVFVDSQKVNDFVNYFKSLSEKDINSACDHSFYNNNTVLSAFDGDTVTVRTALENISRTVNAAIEMKKEIPDIKADNIHALIFYTHIFKIRPLISDELGYSKRPDVLTKVKEGSVLDLKEHLIKNYGGKKEHENKWFEPYRKVYNLKINYPALEYSFYHPADNRK